ncbi:peptidoglycan-binding protein [Lutimaribacter marinistellae]|uniref:Peptidoglycan-binding protein n=1 Tax=Lutimaribacter marinistellae TaxID=1820329 RepID=A0ABV7TFL5_9RHOB
MARPPGWRPPHSRPPGWRPPYYPPPYARPPHHYWGDYYYSPNWGWFFTAALAGSTLAFVADLPSEGDCEPVQSEGETLYNCDGVLYRSTYYQDETVYEILSDPEQAQTVAEPTSVVGLTLTEPLTRGAVVRDLQNRLTGAGYSVGSVDGVFGQDTANALAWFQYDNGFEATGVVDVATAEALGFRPPGTTQPAAASVDAVEDAQSGAEEASSDPEATPAQPAEPEAEGQAPAPANGDAVPRADGDPVAPQSEDGAAAPAPAPASDAQTGTPEDQPSATGGQAANEKAPPADGDRVPPTDDTDATE